MALFSRRRFLSCLGLAGLCAVGARVAAPRLLRVGPPRPLEGAALDFVGERLAGIDRSRVWDVHAHMIGIQGDSGCRIHRDWRDHRRPLKRLQFELILGASGVEEGPDADRDYLERLLAMHRAANPAGRLLLLALDYRRGRPPTLRSSAPLRLSAFPFRLQSLFPPRGKSLVAPYPFTTRKILSPCLSSFT